MSDMSKVKIPCDNGPYREGKGTLYEGGTRVCALAKESTKPLFLIHQSKVVMKGMHGEPILPTDEDFAGVEMP